MELPQSQAQACLPGFQEGRRGLWASLCTGVWSECSVRILPPGLILQTGKLRQPDVQGLCSQTAELACAVGPFTAPWEIMLVTSVGGGGGCGRQEVVRAVQEVGSVGAGGTSCGPWGAEGSVWPRGGGGTTVRWDLEAEPMEIGPRPVGSNLPFLPSLLLIFLLSHFIICFSAKKAF